MKQKKVFLMAGIPGSGKSTWIRSKLTPGAEWISRDNVRFAILTDEDDYFAHEDDVFDITKPLTIFHPEQTYKKTTFENYEVRELMVDIFKDGKLVYDKPSLVEIGKHCDKSKGEFFPEYRRVVNTQEYKVDLSENMWNLKHKLLGSRH